MLSENETFEVSGVVQIIPVVAQELGKTEEFRE
jgi:hypothetical protein